MLTGPSPATLPAGQTGVSYNLTITASGPNVGPIFYGTTSQGGANGYDPANIQAPVGIIRGEWDKACSDADAAWLFSALKNSPMRRTVKISRATHLMHLEESRFALYREAEMFLNGNDLPVKAPSRKNKIKIKEKICSP